MRIGDTEGCRECILWIVGFHYSITDALYTAAQNQVPGQVSLSLVYNPCFWLHHKTPSCLLTFPHSPSRAVSQVMLTVRAFSAIF